MTVTVTGTVFTVTWVVLSSMDVEAGKRSLKRTAGHIKGLLMVNGSTGMVNWRTHMVNWRTHMVNWRTLMVKGMMNRG